MNKLDWLICILSTFATGAILYVWLVFLITWISEVL